MVFESGIDRLHQNLFNILQDHDRIAIIGLGNPIRGDDGAGTYITDALEHLQHERIMILSCYNSPANYLGKIVRFAPDFILFIDAIHHNFFDEGAIVMVSAESVAKVNTYTTHYQGYDTMIEFIASESNKDVEFMVFGINIMSADHSTELTPVIKKSADLLIDVVKEQMKYAR